MKAQLSEKFMDVSDMKVTDEDSFLSRCMLIRSKEHHHEGANLDHCEVDNSESCSEI